MSRGLIFGMVIGLGLGLIGLGEGGNSLPHASAAWQEWLVPEEAAELQNPLDHNAETIAAGKKLYTQNCAVCHGPRGRGRGPAAAALDPKPPRFSIKRVASQPDGVLFWKINHGRAPMPAWAASLSKEEVWQIVHYLHILTGKMKK